MSRELNELMNNSAHLRNNQMGAHMHDGINHFANASGPERVRILTEALPALFLTEGTAAGLDAVKLFSLGNEVLKVGGLGAGSVKSALSDLSSLFGKNNELAINVNKAKFFEKAAESGSDIGMSIAKSERMLSSDFFDTSKLLSKFSVFAKGGIVGLDLINKGIEVNKAPTGEKLRVGFVKAAEFAGEAGGVLAGGAIVGLSLLETGGGSLLLAPAITVGAAAGGGYIAGKIAENIETEYDLIMQKWKN